MLNPIEIEAASRQIMLLAFAISEGAEISENRASIIRTHVGLLQDAMEKRGLWSTTAAS